MATRRIKEITNTATTFASDDFIALDGTSQGTRKMDKDDLISEVSAGVSGDYLEEANNLSDVASLDTSKLNMEIPDVGTAPNEVPMNGQLGSMAYQSAEAVSVDKLEVNSTTGTSTTQAIVVKDSSGTKLAIQEDGSIKGDLRVIDDGGTNTLGLLYDNGTEGILDLRANNSTKIELRTAGNSYFNGGNVGIGTDSPSAPLSVENSSNPKVTFGYGGSNAEHQLAWDSSKFNISADAGNAVANSEIGFFVDGTKRATITSSGELQVTGNGVIKNQESGGNYSYLQQTGSDSRLFVQYSQPLLFGTAATERWRIDGSNGNLVANGTAIDFGAVASGLGTVTPTTGGLLDDFETGTWSPTIAPNTGSFATATTYVYFAKYTKVGNVVTANCYIRTDGTLDTTGGSGSVRIHGLPFTIPNSDFASVDVGYVYNWSAAPAGGYMVATTNKINLTKRVSSVTGNLIGGSVSDLDTSGGAKNEIMLSVTYQTA